MERRSNYYIHTSPRKNDVPIYRVLSVQRLIELFETRQNVLVRPSLWDDPFENIILARAAKLVHGRSGDEAPRDRFYGQCWTLEEESDAMWRIYSPDKLGVKVQTTLGKLFDSLESDSLLTQTGHCFIGYVEYEEKNVILEKISDRLWLKAEGRTPRDQATTLFLKRKEFRHEREVRLLLLRDRAVTDDLYRYPVSPKRLIDEIQFDPRMPDELFRVYRHYLDQQLQYQKPVSKSSLYSLPDLYSTPN